MKVKKALSLILALAMVFTMIPAQMIFSSANYQHYSTEDLGDASEFLTYVSWSPKGDYSANYDLVKVELKLKVDTSSLSDAEKQINAFNSVFSFDTTKLVPVSQQASTRGQSKLDVVKTEAGKAPDYNWTKTKGKTNFAFIASDVPALVYDEDEGDYLEGTVKYSIDSASISYNESTGKMYFNMQGLTQDAPLWNSDGFVTLATAYLGLADGVDKSEVPGAMALATESEMQSTTNGCLARAIQNENSLANQVQKGSYDRFVTKSSIQFSDDFAPAPQTCTVTFTGIKNADGTAADDVVLTPEIGTEVTAPTLSDYSTSEFDYAAAGWDKDVVSPATGDATYTAQYTKKANDKTALQTEVTADDALNEADYTPETWAPFAAKLAAAKTVLANDDATKGAIATALNELVAARSALESPKPVYNILFIWDTADGEDRLIVPTVEGNVPVPPEGSELDYEDATTHYTFTGWDPALVAATGETAYQATYSSSVKKAELTFVYKTADGDKTVKVSNVAYGTNVMMYVPDDAVSYTSADGSYAYTLTGWSPALGTVTGNETYTAQYEETALPADYSAVDTALSAADEIMGAADYAPKYTAASKQALTDAYNAVVRGKLAGEQAAVDAMAAAINDAIGNLEIAKYDVTYNVHGQDPVVTAYNYGTPAGSVESGAPVVDDYSEGDYDYSFKAWEPVFADVTENAAYTATYNENFVAADTTALQTAITDANAKKAQGGWTQESVQNLENLIAQANSEYLEAPSAPGRTKQGAIDNLSQAIANALVAETPVTQYTITFNDYDATQLGQVTVDEGAVVVAPEDPTRADSADGNTSYTFLGWQTPGDTNIYPGNSIPNATANAVYTAVYEETTNYADLTALNNAIAEAEQKQAEEHFNDKYENAARYNDLVNAAKELAASNPLKSQQGYVDAKAHELDSFVLTVKEFTITFDSHEGIADMRVSYGETPIAPPAAGFSDGDYDYTFTGWDNEIVPATADANYNAQYDSTFVSADYTDNAAKVETAQMILDNPESEYIYTADTLSALQTAVDNNAQAGLGRTSQTTVDEATTRINNAILGLETRTYTIKFVVDGQEISSQTLAYGAQVQVPQDPSKAEDETYTYTFTGWNPTVVPDVTRDATYTAQFQPNYKNYTITFVDYDDSVIATQTYHYGDEITPPENPERASDNVYTYDFDAWTPAVPDTVTENATFKATYEATYIDYVISFYDGDGNEIAVQQLHFGDPIVPPATANKTEDETYTYTFTGWNPQVPATVSEGEIGVYVATFEPVYKNYTVKFTVDGADYDVQTLHYGDAIVVPTDPSKDATAEYTYTFAGWSPAVAATVTGDAEYAATFTAEKNRYDVTVVTKDTEGNDLTATTSVEYGETPVLPEPATNFVVGTTKYTFIGWDKTVAPVTGPVTYTAQYETSTVTNPVYTVNFKFAETAEQAESKQFADHTQSIEQNDMPNVPTPANFETATMKYEFSGWDKDVVAATGDAVYTAQYTETPILQNFEINFRYADSVAQVEDGELADHIQVVTEGNMPEIPTPADFVDGNTTYTFVGWDKDVVAATGDAVYTAVYQAETPVILDYSKFEALVERYEQMVLTGLYNKKDLKAVKEFIDEIYDMIENGEFTSQDEVDAVTYELKVVEDSVRRIEKHETEEEEETTTRRTSRRTSPATGDNATLVVMSVILVSSIGLAVISLKKKRENI